MCDECGCGEKTDEKGVHTEKTILLDRPVREANDRLAHQTWHELQEKGVLCVNIMGAPGSGKTTFIESLAMKLDAEKLAVIQGDLESDIDKQRLGQRGIATFQINTHSGCHLNAQMIADALKNFSLQGKEYLLIENVGNLVCPAGVKLGQHLDVVVSATTEGSDKPRKYPHIFREAKLLLITKHDLKEVVEFDETAYLADLKKINARAKILSISKDEESLQPVADFLLHERQHLLEKHHAH